MADRIEIKGMKAHGYHGVLAHERDIGQEFSIDIVCWLDLKAASKSDDVADTINYAELAQRAHEVITSKRFNLIEKVGGFLADDFMATYPQLFAVEITVHKPSAPVAYIFDDIAVVIRRSRR
ncbi:dihydroneopterin aldolase [Corynebacterium sp. ES2794-CONJ1]|uniref:dihydroneopterin aldolase n=1 Tax=unclassified Corynebacterium TaxID=2624378 RepID=UPI0021672FA1|nr:MULTISPECIES: dihydroneopterin aldolase [unclassified Corynebacterium]MCS4490243.1 dihydroneopterin aldolase [Corynebacterium sp. ES2775-CONJ]MCS4491946.1 dihydroneopterin aldolase [Corynebacterium sp. ES2715-CONJ3]MCS4532051.1 dihydroneopterin aldolase [Corynebacterium sp. ES2730-CONJ]MCU9519452.1 dihydroneopterin aldolase [Corynebacterium sp. ES2794-CONJ1]